MLITGFWLLPRPEPVTSPVVTNSATIEPSLQSPPNCVHFETVSTSAVPPLDVIPPVSNGIIDREKIIAARSSSCSRRNFAAKLVAELFDEDTRKRSNVSGKAGKLRLNPVLMEHVRSLTFQYYPLELAESEKAEWAKCVISIDEFNRRLKNKPKKSLPIE